MSSRDWPAPAAHAGGTQGGFWGSERARLALGSLPDDGLSADRSGGGVGRASACEHRRGGDWLCEPRGTSRDQVKGRRGSLDCSYLLAVLGLCSRTGSPLVAVTGLPARGRAQASLRRPLCLWSSGSAATACGLGGCGSRASELRLSPVELRLSCSMARGTFLDRSRTRVSCTGSWILHG